MAFYRMYIMEFDYVSLSDRCPLSLLIADSSQLVPTLMVGLDNYLLGGRNESLGCSVRAYLKIVVVEVRR